MRNSKKKNNNKPKLLYFREDISWSKNSLHGSLHNIPRRTQLGHFIGNVGDK